MAVPEFIALDDIVYDAEKPLDTFLLNTTRDNLGAARQARGRMGVWTPGSIHGGAYTVPRWCSYDQPAVVPFLWHLPPGVEELTVVVRHTVPSNVSGGGVEVTWRGSVVPIGRATQDGVVVLADGTDAAAVAQQTNPVNTTLTLDVTDVQRGWVVVFLALESTVGSGTQIEEGTGKGNLVLANWTTGRYEIDSSQTTITTGDLPDAPCMVVAPLDIGSTSRELRLPSPRQVLRRYTSGGGDVFIDIWPPIGEDYDLATDAGSVDTSSDALYQYPLGYADVRSVAIYESGIADLPTVRAAIDAGAYTSAPTVALLVGEQVATWMQYGRVHHMGPLHDPQQSDTLDTSIPVNRVGRTAVLSNSYTAQAECVVGSGDTFTWAGDGTTRVRALYQVCIVFGLTVRSGRAEDRDFDLDLRLRLTDLDDTSNEVIEELETVRVRATRTPQQPVFQRDALQAPSWALLARYHAARSTGSLCYHALRGTWPESAWRENRVGNNGGWYNAEPVIMDTNNGAHRKLSLDAKMASLADVNGLSFDGDLPHIHVVSFTVIDAATVGANPATPDGSELGSAT